MMPPDVLERFLEQFVAAADLALVGIGGNEHAFAQQPADFARARGILLRRVDADLDLVGDEPRRLFLLGIA
jgi:hypothetical protein